MRHGFRRGGVKRPRERTRRRRRGRRRRHAGQESQIKSSARRFVARRGFFRIDGRRRFREIGRRRARRRRRVRDATPRLLREGGLEQRRVAQGRDRQSRDAEAGVRLGAPHGRHAGRRVSARRAAMVGSAVRRPRPPGPSSAGASGSGRRARAAVPGRRRARHPGGGGVGVRLGGADHPLRLAVSSRRARPGTIRGRGPGRRRLGPRARSAGSRRRARRGGGGRGGRWRVRSGSSSTRIRRIRGDHRHPARPTRGAVCRT